MYLFFSYWSLLNYLNFRAKNSNNAYVWFLARKLKSHRLENKRNSLYWHYIRMRLSEKFSNTVALSKDMFSVPALLLILGSKRLESLYPQREENPLIFLREVSIPVFWNAESHPWYGPKNGCQKLGNCNFFKVSDGSICKRSSRVRSPGLYQRWAPAAHSFQKPEWSPRQEKKRIIPFGRILETLGQFGSVYVSVSSFLMHVSSKRYLIW